MSSVSTKQSPPCGSEACVMNRDMSNFEEEDGSVWLSGEDISRLVLKTLGQHKMTKYRERESEELEGEKSFRATSRCLIECPSCHKKSGG